MNLPSPTWNEKRETKETKNESLLIKFLKKKNRNLTFKSTPERLVKFRGKSAFNLGSTQLNLMDHCNITMINGILGLFQLSRLVANDLAPTIETLESESEIWNLKEFENRIN